MYDSFMLCFICDDSRSCLNDLSLSRFNFVVVSVVVVTHLHSFAVLRWMHYTLFSVLINLIPAFACYLTSGKIKQRLA